MFDVNVSKLLVTRCSNHSDAFEIFTATDLHLAAASTKFHKEIARALSRKEVFLLGRAVTDFWIQPETAFHTRFPPAKICVTFIPALSSASGVHSNSINFSYKSGELFKPGSLCSSVSWSSVGTTQFSHRCDHSNLIQVLTKHLSVASSSSEISIPSGETICGELTDAKAKTTKNLARHIVAGPLSTN